MFDPIVDKRTLLSVVTGAGDNDGAAALSISARNGALVQEHENTAAEVSGRKVWSLRLPVLFGALAVAALAVLSLIYQPAVEVTVNGETLGLVSSAAEFDAAVDRVEQRVSGLLGTEYTYPYEISYHRTIVQRDQVDAAVSFEDDLMDQVGAVIQGYVLTVDGVTVGAAEDRETLENLLLEAKAAYEDENTVSVEYTQDVALTYRYVASDMILEPEAIADNLAGTLSLLVTKNVVYETEQPYAVEYVEDPSLPLGETEIRTPGVNGVERITAQIRYQDGEVVESSILSTDMAVETVNEVIAVGSISGVSVGSFQWPLQGTISSPYGYRDIFGSTSFHSGIDISASYGTEFRAADGGVVTFCDYQGTYGNLIIVDHGDGLVTYYAHCSDVLVCVGDKVHQGQVIGMVGTTGRATGPHLHFEIRVNGEPIDPIPSLP